MIRDVRGTIRAAVDFGGLTAGSHRRDFLGWFAPLSSFLAAGPPVERLRQVLALIDAGIVEIAGPESRFTADEAAGTFTVSSPRVPGSERSCPVLIDARIPEPDVRRDPAPLSRQLTGSGTWTPWTNRAGAEPLRTGGVAVTEAPFRPVGSGGRPAEGLYVLGIPCEGPRWFTQVGSARPGPWTEFTADADAIAADILGRVPSAGAVPVLEGERR